jgi:hypothetical protein
MFRHFADERERGQAVPLLLSNFRTFAANKDRRYKGGK